MVTIATMSQNRFLQVFITVILFDRFVDLLDVIKMQVTHWSTKVKLLLLEEILVSLLLELVGFMTKR